MSRPVFGVTDSPRLARAKRRIAARERALRSPESPHVAVIERGPTGEPERLVFVRNPHYRKQPVYSTANASGVRDAR